MKVNNLAEFIKDYLELNSSYKVAKKYNITATAAKKLLKEAGVLRTQSEAAKARNNPNLGKYKRMEDHKKNLSELASKRTGNKNPFFGKKHSNETKSVFSEIAKERTGKRNPNYKNGNYERRPRDFKISEFTPVRNRVFNRDDHSCYYCRNKGGHLHAHHILPYWIMPSAFLDDENLITVCTTCHFKEAHNGNWHKFDLTPITDYLLNKYSLNRERLNELAGKPRKR